MLRSLIFIVGLFFISTPIKGFVQSDRFAWTGPLRPVSYKNIDVYKRQMLFIDENKGVFTSPEVHDVYKGEFLALRAFLHFDILRLFAPSAAMNNNKGLDALAIPYVDVFTNIAQSQLTVKEVLKKIETDLLAAKQLMKGKEEFKFSDTSDPLYNRKQRMNYYAVTALLARVYLWGNDKEAALKEAKEIIGEADGESPASYELANRDVYKRQRM